MVRLAGDVAPERFNGFYNQVAPGVDLMKRQFQDIPSPDFLVRQSGLHAGFPKPRTKLRNIDGFMNSSTNFNSVQNAPHFIRMRYQHLAQRAAERAARELEENRKKIHYLRQMDADRKEARRTKVKETPYKSEAAGLKLKQAQRQVLYKGAYRMQRETTRSVKQKKLLDKFVGRDSDALLRKIAKVEEPLDEDDLDELKRADKRLQDELKVAVAATPGGVAPQTVERLRRLASMREIIPAA
jgi:hypothetical protein